MCVFCVCVCVYLCLSVPVCCRRTRATLTSTLLRTSTKNLGAVMTMEQLLSVL